MAEMTPARKRLAILFVAVGIGLIVERTLASDGDVDAKVVASTTKAATPDDMASAAPLRVAPVHAASDAPSVLHLEALVQRHLAALQSDGSKAMPIFSAQSWQPPPPSPTPVQAVEPEAPPFPYPYLGGLTDDAGRTAFFGRGDRVLAVRSGATIDGQYRVDHLDETSMTLTYLPLHKPLAVTLGGRP
jgi:hypothetical protein